MNLEEQISILMSNKHWEQKQLTSPFLKRLLDDKEQYPEYEQEFYKFIFENWLWCIPTHSRNTDGTLGGFKGYRVIDKEKVVKMFSQY